MLSVGFSLGMLVTLSAIFFRDVRERLFLDFEERLTEGYSTRPLGAGERHVAS